LQHVSKFKFYKFELGTYIFYLKVILKIKYLYSFYILFWTKKNMLKVLMTTGIVGNIANCKTYNFLVLKMSFFIKYIIYNAQSQLSNYQEFLMLLIKLC